MFIRDWIFFLVELSTVVSQPLEKRHPLWRKKSPTGKKAHTVGEKSPHWKSVRFCRWSSFVWLFSVPNDKRQMGNLVFIHISVLARGPPGGQLVWSLERKEFPCVKRDLLLLLLQIVRTEGVLSLSQRSRIGLLSSGRHRITLEREKYAERIMIRSDPVSWDCGTDRTDLVFARLCFPLRSLLGFGELG